MRSEGSKEYFISQAGTVKKLIELCLTCTKLGFCCVGCLPPQISWKASSLDVSPASTSFSNKKYSLILQTLVRVACEAHMLGLSMWVNFWLCIMWEYRLWGWKECVGQCPGVTLLHLMCLWRDRFWRLLSYYVWSATGLQWCKWVFHLGRCLHVLIKWSTSLGAAFPKSEELWNRLMCLWWNW